MTEAFVYPKEIKTPDPLLTKPIVSDESILHRMQQRRYQTGTGKATVSTVLLEAIRASDCVAKILEWFRNCTLGT